MPFHGGQAVDDDAGFAAFLAGGGFITEPQYPSSPLCRIGQAADAHRSSGRQVTVQPLS
jgi:hypothetical protein